MSTLHFEAPKQRPRNHIICEHSAEQGGVDAGLFTPPDGSQPYWLIVALLPESRIEPNRWGPYGMDAGAMSDWDGRANMEAILRADPDNAIARHIKDLEIGGHRDFHWASKLETDHLYQKFGTLIYAFISGGWVWTSTQYSANTAWIQNFHNGDTSYWYEDDRAGALAVRRFYPSVLQ